MQSTNFSAAATVNAVFHLQNLGDQKEAMRWLVREISRPRNAESAFTESALYPMQILVFGAMGELGDVRRIMSEASNSESAFTVTATGQLMIDLSGKATLEKAAAGLNAFIGIARHQGRAENICSVGPDAAPSIVSPATTPRPRNSCGRASRIQSRVATSSRRSMDVSASPTYLQTWGVRTRPEVSLDDAARSWRRGNSGADSRG